MEEKNLKDLKFPQYISTSEKATSVVGFIDGIDANYIARKGYIKTDDGTVWIYCDEIPGKGTRNEYPYFWKEEGELRYSSPEDLIRNAYTVDHMLDSSVTAIVDVTKPNEELYNEAEILDINASSSFYVPIIYDTDDFLKKVVKIAIIEKGIDINRLKSKTDKLYILPNMRTALQGKTKMSVSYFQAWMELLGLSFDITIRDNGDDKTNALKDDHIYDVEKDKMIAIRGGQEVPIDVSKYCRKRTDGDDE